MYNKNFKNQAVKEVKNGSSVNSVAKKFNIAVSTLVRWTEDYDKKMFEMTNEESPTIKPVNKGIELQSIKVFISGAIVTLKRNDVLKMLKLFNIFDERLGEE